MEPFNTFKTFSFGISLLGLFLGCPQLRPPLQLDLCRTLELGLWPDLTGSSNLWAFFRFSPKFTDFFAKSGRPNQHAPFVLYRTLLPYVDLVCYSLAKYANFSCFATLMRDIHCSQNLVVPSYAYLM